MQVLILGGGVAGLAAAISVRRSGHRVTVLEARSAGLASARNAHVHRLSPQTTEALRGLSPAVGDALIQAGACQGRLGEAGRGRVRWSGDGLVSDLAMLECALADVAAVEGGELVRGDPVMAIRATPTGWLVTTQSGRNLATDLLVDATGAARISLSLLEADLPDVALDDLGSPQGYVSWRGRAPGAETWLLAWGSAASLEGLIQSTASGRIRLTCRHGAGAAAPETPPLGEIMESGGDEMARMLGGVRFESKAVRYWAPAARRIALDEMPVTERPLPVLVGDALVQTPPRFGEGIRQALNHAERLGAMLSGGTAVHGLARELALDARRVWLGAGLATPPTGAV